MVAKMDGKMVAMKGNELVALKVVKTAAAMVAE